MAAPQHVEQSWPEPSDWRSEDEARASARSEETRRPPIRRLPSGPADIAHVLHVEPGTFARRLLRITLSHPRVCLTQVETGAAAIELLAIKPYDMVLMSLNLADMTAHETLAWIRRSVTPWADVPVIGLRDGRQRDRIGELMSLGLTDWTPRGVNRQQLSDKLVALLPALYDAGL